jgi:hypothetical protein
MLGRFIRVSNRHRGTRPGGDRCGDRIRHKLWHADLAVPVSLFLLPAYSVLAARRRHGLPIFLLSEVGAEEHTAEQPPRVALSFGWRRGSGARTSSFGPVLSVAVGGAGQVAGCTVLDDLSCFRIESDKVDRRHGFALAGKPLVGILAFRIG